MRGLALFLYLHMSSDSTLRPNFAIFTRIFMGLFCFWDNERIVTWFLFIVLLPMKIWTKTGFFLFGKLHHYDADDGEVKEWIIKNALGTRNLTEMQITDLRGRLFQTRKKRRGNPNAKKSDGTFQKSEKPTIGDTAKSIATDLGINRNTVYEAANFVDGLDAAEAVVPGFKDAVLTGEVKAQKQEVAAMRKQTPDEIKKSVETIKERKSKRITTPKVCFCPGEYEKVTG